MNRIPRTYYVARQSPRTFGVYNRRTKVLVEGGFFSRQSAYLCADAWERIYLDSLRETPVKDEETV
jgi:hypothetical protein